MASMFSTAEMGFIRYLNSTAQAGHGESMLHYDPDRFYKEMHKFYHMDIGDI